MFNQLHFNQLQKKHFSKTREYFYRWRMQDKISLSHTRRRFNPILSENHKVENLLDVGCGEGGSFMHLKDVCKKYVGVDFSIQLGSFFKTELRESAEFICGSILNLPFKDNTFDTVVCKDMLHHIAINELDKSIYEIIRVCKNRGKILITEPNRENLYNYFISAVVMKAERNIWNLSLQKIKEGFVKNNQPDFNIYMNNVFGPIVTLSYILNRWGHINLFRIHEYLNKIEKKIVPSRFWSEFTLVVFIKK